LCHVSTISDDTTPAWIFAVEQSKSVLKGLLKSAKLGEVAAKQFRMAAAFQVAKKIFTLQMRRVYGRTISRQINIQY
jgi:hypothetical protein